MRLTVLLILVLLMRIMDARGQNLDVRVLESVYDNRDSRLEGPLKLITNTATPLAVAGALTIGTVAYLSHDPAQRPKIFDAAGGLLVALAVTQALKYSFDRQRPYATYPNLFTQRTSSPGPSFPSGHTSNAFAFATALSLDYPRWYVIAPAYAWAGAVGYSRMYLGAHYPSDVLAGAIIGTGSSYLSYRLTRYLTKRYDKRHPATQ